jgi:hypothetical protein
VLELQRVDLDAVLQEESPEPLTPQGRVPMGGRQDETADPVVDGLVVLFLSQSLLL